MHFPGNAQVNWSSDDDTLPEMLPKKMVGKTDDDVQKAVFQAYATQLKVISEYSGHVLEPDSPYGFFKDEMPITNARTSNPQSDLVFYNNAIRGFIGHDKNSITVKWSSDQVNNNYYSNILAVTNKNNGRYTSVSLHSFGWKYAFEVLPKKIVLINLYVKLRFVYLIDTYIHIYTLCMYIYIYIYVLLK